MLSGRALLLFVKDQYRVAADHADVFYDAFVKETFDESAVDGTEGKRIGAVVHGVAVNASGDFG